MFKGLRPSLNLGACLTVALTLLEAGAAHAQISGFNNGANFTVNGNGSGTPGFTDPNTLAITTGQYFEANSAFYNTAVGVQSFVASFDYSLNPNFPNDGLSPADGCTFTLQNDSRGVNALGLAGGDLGYSNVQDNTQAGITPSVAIAFNQYAGNGQGTAFLSGGTSNFTYNDVSPVSLADPMHVVLTYDGSTLTENLTDTTTNATYSASYAVDIVSLVGGTTALVGFTGGTGSGTSTQLISNFQFNAVPEPASLALLGLAAAGLRRRKTTR